MASSHTSPGSTPTLVHAAELAGVGLGTASRAVRGPGYVSEETSARIRSAVEQLGYQRNDLARSLKASGYCSTQSSLSAGPAVARRSATECGWHRPGNARADASSDVVSLPWPR